MEEKYFLTSIIGDGTRTNPYRSAIAQDLIDSGISFEVVQGSDELGVERVFIKTFKPNEKISDKAVQVLSKKCTYLGETIATARTNLTTAVSSIRSTR